MNTRRVKFSIIVLLLIIVTVGACDLKEGAIPVPTQDTSSAGGVPTQAPPSEDQDSEPPTRPASSGREGVAGPAPTPTEDEGPIPSHVPIGDVAPVQARVPSSFKGGDDARQGESGKGSGYMFAVYRPGTVQQEGQVFAPAIAPDLSNVALTVLLSPQQRERIADIGFVVSPGETKEFYELYERARYNYVPVFVTSDSLLHVYHLLFDKTLRSTETEFLIPMLTRLNWALLKTSIAQYEELEGTRWAEAARRNAAYFAVAVKILNPDWTVPEGLRDLTAPDLASIASHRGIGPSAIFPAYPEGEDWSQYVPRGHYTKSDALKRYFVAMMWHGRMTFRAIDPTETRQAALLTLALQQTQVDGQSAWRVWAGIYEPTVFFVGRSDDLTPGEYEQALEAAYGPVSNAQDLVDEATFAQFQEQAKNLRPPEILGMVINRDEPDVDDTTKGLRFMGQRFVPDAFVFRQLIDRNVPGRMLPKGLDFFAVLGSERALGHLEASGDTAAPNYMDQMTMLRDTFAGYDEQTWTQNLYWTWIHTLRPLLEPVGPGYPQFMQNPAWLDKQLTTTLGSWTELKRDTILYAKQVYAERGAGALPPPTPEQPKGYVEPMPLFYARIAALAQMTIDGLDSRGLLNDEDRQALAAMVQIAGRLQAIAEKQLANDPISEDDYTFIRHYGAEIEALTFAADDEAVYRGRGGSPAGGEPLQAAVVADVATDPNGFVLEEGVGRVFEIYAVVPVEGQLVLAKGGVFSHYEFVQPMSDRLTDEAWREMLDRGDAPPLADWTSSFLVEEKAEQALADTILEFNNALVRAFWYTDASLVADFLGPEELEDTRRYIEDELVAQGHFLGSKRLSLNYLSFDFQDATHAVVTTEERWFDEHYRGAPDYGSEQEKIRENGPYDLIVTYTMEKQGDRWIILNIVTRSPDDEES